MNIIEETVLKYRPEIVIIDSIQTMFKEEVSSAPGSVSQVQNQQLCLCALQRITAYPFLLSVM